MIINIKHTLLASLVQIFEQIFMRRICEIQCVHI